MNPRVRQITDSDLQARYDLCALVASLQISGEAGVVAIDGDAAYFVPLAEAERSGELAHLVTACGVAIAWRDELWLYAGLRQDLAVALVTMARRDHATLRMHRCTATSESAP